MQILDFLDLAQNEVRNVRLQGLASDPGSAVDALFFYRTDTHKVRVRINGVWRDLATTDDVSAGGISSAIVDAKGDLIVATAADTVARKPAGVDGTTLFSNAASGDGLEWRNLVAGDIPTLTLAKISDSGTAAAEDTTAFDAAGTAATAVSNHEAAADPHIGYQLESEKGVANGYAGLDSGGRVPLSQMHATALSEIHVVADITARDGLTVQEGDTAIVQDAGADPEVAAGQPATYLYDGVAWQRLESPVGEFVTAVTATGYLTSTEGTTPEIAWGNTDLAVADGGTGASDAPTARANLGATTKYTETIGDGVATEYTITHNMNSRAVTVEVFRNTDPWDTVGVTVERPSLNAVLVRFASAPATNAFDVVVVG